MIRGSAIGRNSARCVLHMAIVAILGFSLCSCGTPETDSVPLARGANIILIVVDTLRADHLGVYGYPRETSPNIDAFAHDALLFRHAYTPRPKTTPAMASLFTSSPPHVHGVRRIPQALPEAVLYMPEELQRQGYTTAAVVSNSAAGRDFGFARGFDFWKQPGDVGGHVTDTALSRLDSIEGSKDGRPFFLWVHYLKPHAPYQPYPEYHSMFVGDTLWAESQLPFSEHKFGSYRELPQVVNIDGNSNPYYYIAEYDAEIRSVDAEIGRLLGGLRTRGLYDSSIIVLTADHGESLGDHDYYFDHGMLPYDACGRVPLVIRHPGLKPKVVDSPASLLDIFPTLLPVVGLAVPGEAMGIDLFAAAKAGDSERQIFAESGYNVQPQISVRKNGWKLIYNPSKAERKSLHMRTYELYNTANDPLEEKNLAGQGLDIERTLARALSNWLASWKDYSLPEERAMVISDETMNQLRALGYVE